MKPPKITDNAIDDLALSLSSLIRRIRAEAPPGLQELSWTQKAVLARLEKDGPTTTAGLARAEGVKPQSMGAAVEALEKLKLVERKSHPTDGRQRLIKISSTGIAIRKTTKDAKRNWLAHSVAKLEKSDQSKLFAAAEIFKRLADL